ncbi:MAG: hypothetical protein RR282_00475 [Acinetobacter sp.]
MKKLIMAAVIAMSASTANAAETYCESIYNLAASIMAARQGDVSQEKLKKSVKSKVGHSLVLWAYKLPKYRGEEMKEYAVNVFAEEAYYDCKSITNEH